MPLAAIFLPMDLTKDIAVIGAGPTGLMAAEVLAGCGHRVTIYDRMATPGRKFLMAGRGGLNLTHSEPLDRFVTRYGEAADWLGPHIRAFPPKEVRAGCEEMGEPTFIGTSGRVFPRSMKAAPMLRTWLRRLNEMGVRFAMRHTWWGWEGTSLAFANAAGEEVIVSPYATLLALGGASWPRLGADGSWVDILAPSGVEIEPLKAANCGFSVPWSQLFRSRYAGQPLKPLAITHNGVTHQGEAMITLHGLEGGVVYAHSAALRKSIEKHGRADMTLDLRPGMSHEDLTRKLDIPRTSKSLSKYLQRTGLSPMIISLLHESIAHGDLTQAPPHQLARQIKAMPLTFTATAGLARAISTAGGVKREALTEDFMLKAIPGVFVAGEMLDWEAPTGGYLLQGCFSTAVAAAKGVLRYCEQQNPEAAIA